MRRFNLPSSILSEIEPQAMAVSDVDGDQHPDVVFVNHRSTMSVLLGVVDGTFRPYPTALARRCRTMASLWATSTTTARRIVTPNFHLGYLITILGVDNRTFNSAPIRSDTPAVFLSRTISPSPDFNGDGNLDVLRTGVTPGGVAVMFIHGNGSFANGTTPSIRIQQAALLRWRNRSI
jgi:hypothetical protein